VEAVNTPASKRDETQRAELAQYYRGSVSPEAQELKEKLAAHAKKQPRLPETKAAILVEEDRGRDTRGSISLVGCLIRTIPSPAGSR
jgi:hypothetical protein